MESQAVLFMTLIGGFFLGALFVIFCMATRELIRAKRSINKLLDPPAPESPRKPFTTIEGLLKGLPKKNKS